MHQQACAPHTPSIQVGQLGEHSLIDGWTHRMLQQDTDRPRKPAR
jgi:hypothetical protein